MKIPARLSALAFLAVVVSSAIGCTPQSRGNESPASSAVSNGAPVASTASIVGSTATAATPAAPAVVLGNPSGPYTRPPVSEIAKLTPMQIDVTQHEGTEPPFRNAYWNNHAVGLYVDIVSGEPLFSSRDKFESGTGWPSFTRPVEAKRILSSTDSTLGMDRTEVKSSGAQTHLGHVFEDGPAPTGLRYCINSASLRFIPLADLDAAGYGAYRAYIVGDGPAPAKH